MAYLPNPRTTLAAAHDLVASAAMWCAAFLLRFNFEIPPEYQRMMWQSLPWVVSAQVGVFWGAGLYKGIWRYASLADLKRIVLSVAFAATGVATVILMLRIGLPRAVLVLDPLLLAMTLAGSRLVYRMLKERRISVLQLAEREPVLVLGAGEAGARLIDELGSSNQWRVAGILDDNPRKWKREIRGIKILGPLNELKRWCEHFSITKVIIALPGKSHAVRRHAVDLCNAARVDALTVPSYDDLISGKVTVSQVRNVELDDLLGRDPVQLDTAGLRDWNRGRTLMITGAGGSIGTELARQVAQFEPKRLVLFELNEFALYSIEQEFAARFPALPITCVVGDVKNTARVDEVLNEWRPNTILHAAAYKHVPLMEFDNAWEAVLNNARGTYVLARSAVKHGVEKFVLVSTDKAVNPTNVMGATKRVAEMICQSMQSVSGTRFIMVRFGNVLGSTGSVIPKFRAQIAAGGPITVTHPEVRRYFMSIPEAAQLVLQAGLMGKGGEIFAMDMGEPVRIADLARDLIRLSGFTSDEIHITFTGLRPGEKLYEEVLADDENSLPTPHPKLRIAKARRADGAWLDGVLTWMSADSPPLPSNVRRSLVHWVPEYTPSNHPRQPSQASAPRERLDQAMVHR